MVTIVLTACPAGLRGHLTRWLTEIGPGVFVGRVNARLREELWALVEELAKDGRAIMTFSTRETEQGFDFYVHRHNWEVVDLDGLDVIRRPRERGERVMRKGWSTASHLRRRK